MSIDRQTVEYAANLSRIELNAQELEVLSVQLTAILDFIDKLKKASVDNVQPTSHILPLNNILRQDNTKEPLKPERTLENAPRKKGSFFSVPKVMD